MKKTKRVLGSKALSAPAGKVEESAGLRTRTEVSVREAKDQLSSLLQRAAGGEDLLAVPCVNAERSWVQGLAKLVRAPAIG